MYRNLNVSKDARNHRLLQCSFHHCQVSMLTKAVWTECKRQTMQVTTCPSCTSVLTGHCYIVERHTQLWTICLSSLLGCWASSCFGTGVGWQRQPTIRKKHKGHWYRQIPQSKVELFIHIPAFLDNRRALMQTIGIWSVFKCYRQNVPTLKY